MCGVPSGKLEGFVEGGTQVADAAAFPWHVIVYKLPAKPICGGSLVNTKFFVSGKSEAVRSQQNNLSMRYSGKGRVFRRRERQSFVHMLL